MKILFGKRLKDDRPELVPRIVRLNGVRDAMMHLEAAVDEREAWQLVAQLECYLSGLSQGDLSDAPASR